MQPPTMSSLQMTIDSINAEIAANGVNIAKVEDEIESVEIEINETAQKYDNTVDEREKQRLEVKERQLRDEKRQLRDKERQLRDKEMQLRDEKRRLEDSKTRLQDRLDIEMKAMLLRTQAEAEKADAQIWKNLDKIGTPSDVGKSPASLVSCLKRCNFALRIGRFINEKPLSSTVPIPLLFPLFGEFKDCCDNIELRFASMNAADLFLQLSNAMAMIYNNEEARQQVFRARFNKFFDIQLDMAAFGNTDESIFMNCKNNATVPLVIIELKNEPHTSGDPLPQLAAYYANIVRESESEVAKNSLVPTIAISVSGPFFTVYTMVLTTVVQVDRVFTIDFTDIDSNPNIYNQRVALLSNLDIYIAKLKEWYVNHDPSLNSCQPTMRRSELEMPMLPEEWATELTLQRFLGDKSKLVFRAVEKSESFDPKLVKFTRYYNTDVHKKMELLGFAPKLYRAEKMSSGYFAIEMEYLNGYVELEAKHLDIRGVPERLDAILDALRENDYVHGDFRYKNLMIQLDSEGNLVDLKVIDFDLSGKNEADTYPGGLNPQIAWHPAVGWLGKLSFEHDVHFLNLMKAKKSMTREHVLAEVGPPKEAPTIGAAMVGVSVDNVTRKKRSRSQMS